MNYHRCKPSAAALLCSIVLFPGFSFGALVERGGGLIYDTDLNITWLADANYAMTSGYDADGKMTWPDANALAANLIYYDSVRGVTYDDWRLPVTPSLDSSCTQTALDTYNCTGSEMGHLFYNELGGVAEQSIATTHNSNYDLFSNIQPTFAYWSATEYPPGGYTAWIFSFRNGERTTGSKTGSFIYAWAVRDGDVANIASTVPVPAATWLFGSGLAGLVGIARRKKAT